MATTTTTTGGRTPGRRRAEGATIPDGTEAILWRQQFAAALSMSTRQFDTLVAEGKVPKPSGEWQGKRFWFRSAVNEFLRSLAKP